ncbi:arginase [Bacilli bacterium PM5-3]|nr:arginase [Bacilli bacterium PM5-3]MDH6603631.1 arginase [Bacilli bacterium PM5-9]
MKKIEINMSDIGFGANRIGIQHGYTIIKEKYPQLASKINYVPYNYMFEDVTQSNKKFYNTVFEATLGIYNANLDSIEKGKLPVLLGGDHSLALGSVKASLKANEGEDIGLVWIDAHADINTFEITDSGHIHGMPVAGLLGLNDDKYNSLGNDLQIKPSNLVYFATRSIDYGEDVFINKYNILNLTDAKIKASSFEERLNELVTYLKNKVNKVHISLDLDSINPDEIKGVSTPVFGGLKKDEPLKIFKRLSEEFEVVGIDIVEYNPMEDTDEKTVEYVNSLLEEVEKL